MTKNHAGDMTKIAPSSAKQISMEGLISKRNVITERKGLQCISYSNDITTSKYVVKCKSFKKVKHRVLFIF